MNQERAAGLPRRAAYGAMLGLLGLVIVSAAATRSTPNSAKNFILISMDTCRPDHLGIYGYRRPTSPLIDRWAAQGTVFENTFSASNETMFSHAALFTSRHCSELAELDYAFRLPSWAPTMAQLLGREGYATAAFVAGAHLNREFGFARGFDRYEDRWNWGSFFDTLPSALRWLKNETRRPFFLLVHGYDCHSLHKRLFFPHLFDPLYRGVVDPIIRVRSGEQRIYGECFFPNWKPIFARVPAIGLDILSPRLHLELGPWVDPQRHLTVKLERRDVDHIVAHYDGSLTYGAFFVGVFLQAIEESHLVDNTVTILVSDHGEDLLEHGTTGHRATLHNSTTRVPLIITGPEVKPQRVQGMVTLLDVLPTVLELAGTSVPSGLRGQSLKSVLEGRGNFDAAAAISEAMLPMISLRTSAWRFTFKQFKRSDRHFAYFLRKLPLSTNYFELFDVRKDPAEKTNLVDLAAFRGQAEALRLRLAAWHSRTPVVRAASRPAIPPHLLERLKRHGYW